MFYLGATMHDPIDDRITQQVNNKLAARGFCSRCRLTVKTANGQVTLSGIVQYAHQRSAAVSAISGMAGVRRVIDQMTVKPAVKRA
jgi:osmotically-inducible protein OsmY